MSELISLSFLQEYWWLVISILGAALVFLMFVQGGQTLLYSIARNNEERSLLVNALGHKWELTFTTLVTFGGAFFASFPLFYATSFSGAYWIWILVLVGFVLQAVSYEFRNKMSNLLGQKAYEVFLILNGFLATFFVGVVVGSFFTGSNFIINEFNLPEWQSKYHGLELLLSFENVILGLVLFFLSRTNGSLFFTYYIDEDIIIKRSIKQAKINGILTALFFVVFLILIFLRNGFEYDENGIVYLVSNKYFLNLIEMPIVLFIFVIGLILFLFNLISLFKASILKGKRFWFSSIATFLLVFALLLNAGYNNTCYYPSVSDLQSSLNIRNSSSSYFTLSVMSMVSLFIPFVVWYITYAWKSLTKVKINYKNIENEEHKY